MDKGKTKLLEEARERLKACISDEDTERNKMKDDLRFGTLDQWPSEIRHQREHDPNGARPCLTLDKLNQYVVQVVNDMRQNRPAIKIRPVDDHGDIETAKIYAGLVRHIEDQSNASVAYETAGESSTRVGLGYFRVTTEYETPESFNQEIFIRRIPDVFTVYLGPHTQPDGSDAEYGFIVEQVPEDTFEREYPKAKKKAEDFDELGDQPTWRTEKHITVVEYFYKEYEAQTLYFMADGQTVTEKPEVPEQDKRETQKESVKWCKLTGCEILEERDWAGKYIPIIEVIGKETYVDGKRVLWGLTRPVKDNLRMYNYWASAATERMALAPKTPFIGAVGQFAGKEDQWKKANTENRAYLEYNPIDVNGNALPRPERVAPAPVEVAMVQMMQTIEHDVQASLGMYKAAVGEPQGQQSGRAILALQRESDTGTFHFADNLSRSIRWGGKVIVDLIPKIYDTRRVLRILGDDGEAKSAMVDPNQPQAVRKIDMMNGKVATIYNLGVGKYDVTVTVGPSYNTKRMEAVATFAELAKGAADPASAAVMRYLTVKNSDLTSSEEATAMLKALLPPGLNAQGGEDEGPVPASAMQRMQQMAMQGQQMQEKLQEIGQENMQLKSGAAVQGAKVNADHDAKLKTIDLDRQVEGEKAKIAREAFEAKKQLDIDVAAHEADLAERAARAEHDRKADEINFQKLLKDDERQFTQKTRKEELAFERECRAEDMKMQAVEKEEAAAEKSMPKLEQLLAQILKVLQNPPPRQVSIGSLQKDAQGNITGASVATKPTATPTLQ